MKTNWPPSLWAFSAQPAPDYLSLTDNIDVDVAVVGGGFTGLSTAIHLAKAGCSVAVLEAEEPGFGASGRNGGQVNPGWYINPEEILQAYGAKDGERVLDMVNGACDLVFELIETYNIECEAVRPGFIQAARGEGGIALLQDRMRQWRAQNVDMQFLDLATTTKTIGTTAYRSATLDPRGGNLQPLSYARGLARAALTEGVQIFKHCRVSAVEQSGGRWKLSNKNSSVLASKIAFCTNGYTDKAWPGLKRTIIPVSSAIAATEPLPEEILQEILPSRHAVAETARVMNYFKLDANGRFLIGNRGPVYSAPDSDPAMPARKAAEEFFPILKKFKWDFGWGGYIALTPNRQPRLMQIANSVYAGMAYYGRGVAMATAMGKELSLHMLDKDVHIPASSLQQIPLHEFHKLGISSKFLSSKIMDKLQPI